MKSKAVAGIGTKFYRWSAQSTSWDALAEINSIGGPSMSRETIDVTSLDSEGGFREFIGSVRDGGNVSLSMNFTRDTYEMMKDDFEDDENQVYKIVLPDDDETTLEFEGLVSELPLNIDVGDKVTADVTIKVSGQPSLYDGSSNA